VQKLLASYMDDSTSPPPPFIYFSVCILTTSFESKIFMLTAYMLQVACFELTGSVDSS